MIPENKVALQKEEIVSKCSVCSKRGVVVCDKCTLESKIIDRYYQANIPIDYWNREMSNFEGDSKLLRMYNSISEDFKGYYKAGKSMILVGQHGVGKTFFACSVLKQAAVKGYGCLYTTLGDTVSTLIYGESQSKSTARRELIMTSFLCLDEFDSRFISNENSAELFGRILESIIRIRFQNCMPTILISNDVDPSKSLGSSLGASVSSLINGSCKKIFVTGPDFRDTIKKRAE